MSSVKKCMSAGLLLVALGGFICGNALAGDEAGPCNGMKGKNMPAFAEFDLDGDGKIVEQEFNEGHANRMEKMAAEGCHMKHAGDAPGFAGIDTNNDGGISEEEFAAHQAEHKKHMHHGEDKQEQ